MLPLLVIFTMTELETTCYILTTRIIYIRLSIADCLLTITTSHYTLNVTTLIQSTV